MSHWSLEWVRPPRAERRWSRVGTKARGAPTTLAARSPRASSVGMGTREAGTGPRRSKEPRGFLLFCCKRRSRSQPRSPGDQEAPAAAEGSRRVRIKEQRGTTCRARPGGGVQARRRRKLPPGTRFPRSPAAGRGLAPRGKQRAPRSLGATTVAPGRSGAGSRPAPSSAGVTAPASGKPLRGRRSKQHRRGAGAPGRRRHSGRPG